MVTKMNGLNSGQWGFHESWPVGGTGPVFDVTQGSTVVARMEHVDGSWRLSLPQSTEAANNLAYLLQMMSILADRMRSVEGQQGKRLGLSAHSQSGEELSGAETIRRLMDALQTPKDDAHAADWGERGSTGAAVTASARA